MLSQRYSENRTSLYHTSVSMVSGVDNIKYIGWSTSSSSAHLRKMKFGILSTFYIEGVKSKYWTNANLCASYRT